MLSDDGDIHTYSTHPENAIEPKDQYNEVTLNTFSEDIVSNKANSDHSDILPANNVITHSNGSIIDECQQTNLINNLVNTAESTEIVENINPSVNYANINESLSSRNVHNEDCITVSDLSDDEKNAVQEIDSATADTTYSSSKSLSDKLLEFSKSVSPPVFIWGSTSFDMRSSKQENKSKFSSLNNLTSRLLDTRPNNVLPMTSASMSDLDKFDNDILLAGRLRGEDLDGMSSISNEISELDAYDQVKNESVSLDEKVDLEKLNLSTATSVLDLQKTIKKLEYELDVANGTIKHVYDESTKKIQEVSKQYESKIAHIDKKFIECIKEKDIMKSSFDECMDARRKLQSNKENLIKSLSNQADENERLRAKLNMSTDDCIKLKKDLDIRTYECSEMKKIIKKLQDDLSSASIKVQWANTKLKSESDAHQLTRTKLSGMDAKIREAKEEANVIRSNCQAMIDKYQHSEEIQSNALGSKLEKLETEHADLQQQFETIKGKYESKCVELEDVNRVVEQIKDQLFEKESDYRRVLQESKTQEDHKMKLANQLEDLDERLNSYTELKAELKNAYHNNQMLDKELINMRERIETVERCNNELTEKEKSNLEYFQKISTKDAELQLEVNSLKMECEGMRRQEESLSSERDDLKQKYFNIKQKHSEQVDESTLLISQLKTKIEELEYSKKQLENEVQDMKNDAVVSKRKHQSDNKDLIRQIEQFRKQFERQEESMRRSESINSIESGDKRNRSAASSEADDSASVSNESGTTMNFETARALLIERLCSLQRLLAKRQEKIEFCESHISTLTKDIQKKSRIVQSLLLRVETGEHTKLASDAYKKSIPVENIWGQPSNGMTLKLSTEINEKLQQVLEDTLFKNITLKENVKTLGDEIDRLNRQL